MVTSIKITREHWNIECGLHWKLNVILDEDYSRSRVGDSINNLSLIKKIVFNLARLDNSMRNNLTFYIKTIIIIVMCNKTYF